MNNYDNLDINLIIPDPDQPRKIFEDSSLDDLCNSIKAIGVKQAITVRKIDDKYMIIAGERRYRASILAGKSIIPAIIIGEGEQLTDEAIYAHQLSENLHRDDLNPIEKAEFINKRIKFLESQGKENAREIVCNELGISQSWLSKSLAPLKLEDDLRQLVMNGKVKDYEIVKKIKSLKGKKKQEAIEKINTGQFNAKEFFSRKKPEPNINNLNKKPEEAENQNGSEKSIEKEESYSFRITRSQLDSLFKSTGFIHTINEFSSDDQETLYTKNKKELVLKFIESFTDV